MSFSPESEEQLLELYTYIADANCASVAEGYVSAIVEFCGGLGDSPFRGAARDDLRAGLRTVGFKRRVMIAFAVNTERVEIIGVFYGRRDYESLLAEDR